MDENEKKEPEPGKKDRSFLAVASGAIVLMALLYFIKLL